MIVRPSARTLLTLKGNPLLTAEVGEQEDSLIQALHAEVFLSSTLGVPRRRHLSPGISEDLLETRVDDLQISRRILLEDSRIK
jgi:hypothetical protein